MKRIITNGSTDTDCPAWETKRICRCMCLSDLLCSFRSE